MIIKRFKIAFKLSANGCFGATIIEHCLYDLLFSREFIMCILVSRLPSEVLPISFSPGKSLFGALRNQITLNLSR